MPSLAGVNYLNTTHFNLIPVTLCSDLYYMFHCVCFLLGKKKEQGKGGAGGEKGERNPSWLLCLVFNLCHAKFGHSVTWIVTWRHVM